MSKAIFGSLNRRGSRSDQSPIIAWKWASKDPSICDTCSAVYREKARRRGRRWPCESIVPLGSPALRVLKQVRASTRGTGQSRSGRA